MGSEFRWAWRAVRARGQQAVLVVVLLGVALAANTIVFSAADAFVFRRTPYPDPERLVVMRYDSRGFGPGISFSAPAIFEWRRQQDVFSAVHAHDLAAPVYITFGDFTDAVRASRVSAGLLEMLGGVPRWGRPIVEGDAREGAPTVAVVAEEIATRAFGSPEGAVGRKLTTASGALTVVGVIPSAFRFPSARERIWLPLVLEGQPRNVGYDTIARLAPEIGFADAAGRVAQRAQPIDRATGSMRRRYPLTLRTLSSFRGNDRYTNVFVMLAAAAVCLLLVACANVVSLELAVAVTRGRALAVQAALGASRLALVRTRLLESAILLAGSIGAALVLGMWGMAALTAGLPAAMALELSNAIDLDARAIGFLTGAAALTWAMTSLPAAWRGSRVQLMDVLRDEARVASLTRSAALVRHTLVVGQVGATVLLVVVALLFARTYAARLNMDKGFDADDLVTFELLPAPDAPFKGQPLADQVSSALSQHPAVRAFALTQGLHPSTAGWIGGKLAINGVEQGIELTMHGHGVTPGYFGTMGIPLVAGTIFEDRAPASRVVVDEAFATRFFPQGGALGSRFNVGSAGFAGAYIFEIIGIARHVRADRTTSEGGRDLFTFYYHTPQPRASVAAVAKLTSEDTLGTLAGLLRARAPRTMVRAESMRARYARLEGDRGVAAFATTAIGALALVIAGMGIYAVMAFLVSGRTREIGIRLALGAEPRAIGRQVVKMSLALASIGAALGLAGAIAASGWLESRLYGVSPTDPLTYTAVAAIVLTAAVIAAWHPARAAARVDPAIALRQA